MNGKKARALRKHIFDDAPFRKQVQYRVQRTGSWVHADPRHRAYRLAKREKP